MKKIVSILALLGSAVSAHAAGLVRDELRAEDAATIASGKQVTRTVERGAIWPEIRVYQKVDATPEEVMAVFIDFELHAKIFEGVAKSTPKEALAPNRWLVDYVMTFPVIMGIQLKDENYTADDSLTTYSDGKGYMLSWKKHSADSIKDISGSVRVEPMEGGGTLMAYFNFIDPPKPQLARLIKAMAIQRTQQTADSLVKQTVKEKAQDPGMLAKQLEHLRESLKGI